MNYGKVFVSDDDMDTRPELVREFFRTIDFKQKEGPQTDLASMGAWYYGQSPFFEKRCDRMAAIVPTYEMILEPEIDIREINAS